MEYNYKSNNEIIMETLKEELKNGLVPLYENLIKQNSFEDVCAFCVQWGKNFPTTKNTGILFVGKAVNGWVHDDIDIDVLFGETTDRIFARSDQMKWVSDLEGNNEIYNTKKSAFWRVVKKISQHFYPTEEWYSNVAWSNLCKIAPFKGGNPSDKHYYEQLNSCQKILAKEIELLSPKFVVMLTSGWEKDFLYFLNDNNHTKSLAKIEWDGYETKLYEIKNTIYIVSQHPQGKNETNHVDVITNMMSKY